MERLLIMYVFVLHIATACVVDGTVSIAPSLLFIISISCPLPLPMSVRVCVYEYGCVRRVFSAELKSCNAYTLAWTFNGAKNEYTALGFKNEYIHQNRLSILLKWTNKLMIF